MIDGIKEAIRETAVALSGIYNEPVEEIETQITSWLFGDDGSWRRSGIPESELPNLLKVALGLTSFDSMTNAIDKLTEAMTGAAYAMNRLTIGIRDYSIVLRTGQIMRQAATRYNHGRARKVSFKQPSPQMSRAQLSQINAVAMLEATLEAS